MAQAQEYQVKVCRYQNRTLCKSYGAVDPQPAIDTEASIFYPLLGRNWNKIGQAESRKKLTLLGEEEGKSLAMEAAIVSEVTSSTGRRGFSWRVWGGSWEF